MKSCNPTSSATSRNGISKNSHFANRRGASCDAECVAKNPLSERRNHRGELPVAVVICDHTGRGLAVYRGQSVAAVAARLGAKDWTSELVGVRP